MNKMLLSLCVFGAGLSTANILIMPRPTCPSAGAEVAAAPSMKSEIVSAAQSKPAKTTNAAAKKQTAPKDEVFSTAQAKPPQAPAHATPPQAPKPAAKPSTPTPQDVRMTGSVGQTPETRGPKAEKPTAVSPDQLAQGNRPAKIEDEPEEWTAVSLAAKVHNAPSVSSPTVGYYRVGVRLKVIGRKTQWVKIADPTTSKEGWIYEKYLMPIEGPDQKKSAQAESNDANVATTTAQPGPYARPYKPRKKVWRRYRYPGPPIGFAIRVY